LYDEYRLQMLGISKSFGGVKAVQNMDFNLYPGEIHALIGENGAGKSTLLRVLSGAHRADEGRIWIDGEEVFIKNSIHSQELGVSVIYQEYSLCPGMTVAENIFIKHINTGSNRKGWISWKGLYQNARELLDRLGFPQIDERATVVSLSIAMQQVVEICKALSQDPKILVLDEPTALLTTGEVEKLFELMFQLRDEGVSIIYVSHRLEEIFRVSSRITVMKDGCYVGTVNTAEIDKDGLVAMMVGRDMTNYYPVRHSEIGDVVFEVKNITSGRQVQGVSFNVRKGEVIVLNGLVGSGRTETAHAIIGMRKLDDGQIFVNGEEITVKNPRDAYKAGIGYLSEDRKNHALFLALPIRYNLTASAVSKFAGKSGFVRRKEEAAYVDDLVSRLQIHLHSIEDKASTLSGGNQQKVAIGKILATDSPILIFDEPTRGVDVGAKSEIYNIINSLAEGGCACVLICSEMEEAMGMADRIVVMHEGHVTGELAKEDFSEINLIHLSMEV
jgi:ribose transport system ATP-binding protein